jgi:hypothetical protein
MIEFPAFNGPKKKPEPRLKGFGGQFLSIDELIYTNSSSAPY